MITFFTSNLLLTRGRPVALILGLLFIGSLIFYKPLLFFVVPLIIFSLYFFRNPERICNERLADSSIIISPADGKVVDIAFDPNNAFEGYTHKISIFLSPFDVHVNWIPVDGVIREINYRPGKFVVAFAQKSSDINERNDIVIETSRGKTIIVRQIAGFIARRICWWVHEGDSVMHGQKYGMIRFGSRVDILLPAAIKIVVKPGDRVFGGCSVLAKWQS